MFAPDPVWISQSLQEPNSPKPQIGRKTVELLHAQALGTKGQRTPSPPLNTLLGLSYSLGQRICCLTWLIRFVLYILKFMDIYSKEGKLYHSVNQLAQTILSPQWSWNRYPDFLGLSPTAPMIKSMAVLLWALRGWCSTGEQPHVCRSEMGTSSVIVPKSNVGSASCWLWL